MKKRTWIILAVTALIVLAGVLLFLFRVQPLVRAGFDMDFVDVEYHAEKHQWEEIDLTDAQLQELRSYLETVNMRRRSYNPDHYRTEDVLFEISIVGRDGPWHIVLGDPCFAYESADHANFKIIKDDAYDALIRHLETLVGK